VRRARRRVLRTLACVAASLASRGGAALAPASPTAASGSAASSPAPRPVKSKNGDAAATPRPPRPASPELTRSALVGGRSFLRAGRDEPPGFGAYGYLLLLAPPRDDELARHLSVLAAWLRQYPTVEEFLQNKLQPSEISLVKLPVRYEPQLPPRPQAAGDAVLRDAATKLLEAYDHARAQAIAARLSLRIAGSGPVLVTLSRPASERVAAAALVENMSGVSPGIADAWMRAAMRAALEPRTWSADALVRLALRMRNVVAQLAATLPDPRLRSEERVQLAQLAQR